MRGHAERDFERGSALRATRLHRPPQKVPPMPDHRDGDSAGVESGGGVAGGEGDREILGARFHELACSVW